MRRLLLPFSGDPFIFNVSMRNLEHIKPFVDEVLVHFDPNVYQEHPEFREFFEQRCRGVTIIENELPNKFLPIPFEQRGVHGAFLKKMLSHCLPEDCVMFLEEDCLLFQPQLVEEWFRKLEGGTCDMVGSFRGFVTMEIRTEFKRIYRDKPWATSNPEMLPGLWPNLFFAHAKHLFNTNGDFGSFHWESGIPIAPLNGYVPVETQSGDTFLKTSLELYAMGLVPFYIPQHGVFECKNLRIFDSVPYLHLNSLATGMNNYLRYEGLTKNLRGTSYHGIIYTEPKEDLKRVRTKDVLLWTLFWEFMERPDKEQLGSFSNEYRAAIDRFANYFGYEEDTEMREILRRRIQREILQQI